MRHLLTKIPSSFDPSFHFTGSANDFTPQPTDFGQQLDSSSLWQDQSASGPDALGVAFSQPGAMQQIVQSRAGTKQQFGQITPPDDTMTDFVPSKQTPAQSAVAQAAAKAGTDKSERARNAANQRHAKKKMLRTDSHGSNPVDSDVEGEGGDKKEKYREKNRLAAAKCRAKKKENIEDIEVKHRKLSAMNSALKKQVQDLRGELTGLRTHALNHQDCSCPINRYNINQAKRVAMGADNNSPSMGLDGGGRSFPFMQSPPGMGMPSRANSFCNPSGFAFASVSTPDNMGGMQSQDGSPHFGDYMPSGFGNQGFSQS